MADQASSSVEDMQETAPEVPENEPDCEPEAKKQKLDIDPDKEEYKLEEKLNGILCCAVCLDLPNVAVYQVRIFRAVKYLHIFFQTL